MIKLLQGMYLAFRVVKEGYQHRNYQRTVTLSEKKYIPLITGEDIDDLLVQFNRRESDDEFKQRKLLTQVITPAICNTLMTPAEKVLSHTPIVREAYYDKAGEGPEQKTQTENYNALWNKISKYFGDGSVDDYLRLKMKDLCYKDPNAFILTVMEDYDRRTGQAQVYSKEIMSRDVYDFEIHNDILQYLIIHHDIKYEVKSSDGKTEQKDGHFFAAYLTDDHIFFEQIDASQYGESYKDGKFYDAKNGQEVILPEVITDRIGNKKYSDWTDYPAEMIFRKSKDEVFQVNIYSQKSGRVQAFRIGYKLDPYTDGRTCVNGFHAAMPYLLKSIKAVSELDLSTSLHAFPQKINYAPRCKGQAGKMCNRGFLPDGNKCSACNGTGYESHHGSSQDHITLDMPANKDEMMELTNMVRYVELPTEILTWMGENIDKIEQKAIRAVYASDTFVTSTNVATATEKMIDLQSVYDSLQPLANRFSFAWKYIVQLLATFNNLQTNLVVQHKFPKNFKTDNVEAQIQLIKTAKDAGIDESAVVQMQEDLLALIYVDTPDKLLKVQTKNRFNPFHGKPDGLISQIMSGEFATQFSKVLYAELDNILAEVEIEQKADSLDFYKMTYEKQKALIDKKVNDKIAEIEAAKPKAPSLSFPQ